MVGTINQALNALIFPHLNIRNCDISGRNSVTGTIPNEINMLSNLMTISWGKRFLTFVSSAFFATASSDLTLSCTLSGCNRFQPSDWNYSNCVGRNTRLDVSWIE